VTTQLLKRKPAARVERPVVKSGASAGGTMCAPSPPVARWRSDTRTCKSSCMWAATKRWTGKETCASTPV